MNREEIKSSDILRDLHIYFNGIEDLQKKENEINSFISSLEDFKTEIHNEKIGITEENLGEKIKEFLDSNYSWLKKEERKYGTCYIYNYSRYDYDDYIQENDVLKIIKGKTKEERQDTFYELLDEFGYQWEFDVIDNIALAFCDKYDYISHDTEIQDILVNLISFNYDTYLSDTYKVNILIDFNNQDSNYEFSTSGNLENCKHNNLYTLLKKQGYSKKDYEENLKTKDNKFLNSIKEEILNCCYEWGNTVVVLQELTLGELIENDNFLVSKNNMIGLFNCFNGSGSILEIQLEKDFTINRKRDVYDIQVEGAKNNNYTVNEVYGLIGECWK